MRLNNNNSNCCATLGGALCSSDASVSLVCSAPFRFARELLSFVRARAGGASGLAGGAGRARPTACVLAFVPGGDEYAAALANELIARVPPSCVLVLAFDQETRFGNEWVASQWPHVRVLSWKDDGAPITLLYCQLLNLRKAPQ